MDCSNEAEPEAKQGWSLAFRAHSPAEYGKGREQPKELAPRTDEQSASDKDLLRERRKQSAGPIRAVNTELFREDFAAD